MPRRLSILQFSIVVALLLPLAAAAAFASPGSGTTPGDTPMTLAEFVRSGQARACLGLRNKITWTTVTSLSADWVAAHPDARGLNGRPLWGTPQSWRRAMNRDLHALDRHAALFLETYGTKALGGCLAQPRHASGATRHFANLACRLELKAPGLAPALGGKLYAPDRWNGLGKCMNARSTTVARLARTQVEAATSCHAALTAGPTAFRAGPVTFGACILQAFER